MATQLFRNQQRAARVRLGAPLSDIYNMTIPKLVTTEFCGPCKMVKSKLHEMHAQYELVDLLENRELSTRYGIRKVPALVLEDEKRVLFGSDEIIKYFSDL
jgi:glutaredoxin